MRNLKKLILTILLPVMGGVVALAQTSVKVSGVVTSSDDGFPMIGVAVMDGQGNGVVTSLDGDYEIVVAPGTELIFSSIGFNTREGFVVADNATFIRLNGIETV